MTEPQNENKPPEPAKHPEGIHAREGLRTHADGDRTENITDLLVAFNKAQGEMPAAEMDKESGAFGRVYKYASLSSILKASKSTLAKHGLSIMQTIEGDSPRQMVVTTLYHISGQWRRGRVPLFLEKQTSHGLGSAITYSRRYGLSMLVGCETDGDDDGQASEDSAAGAKAGAKGPKNGKPNVTTRDDNYQKTPEQLAAAASMKQKNMVFAVMTKELAYNEDDAKRFFLAVTGKQSSKEWTGADIDAILKAIPEEKKRQKAAGPKVAPPADPESAREPDESEFNQYPGGPI